LKCSDVDFNEINAADARGIDMVRDIGSRLGAAPLGGDSRVWLLDEVHSLSSDAQNAILKYLEDTPRHVYFFLCTTDPQKLKKTIITRCTEVRCRALEIDDLVVLVRGVSAKEGVDLPLEVAEKIANCSDGSARKSLVLLQSVITIKDIDLQIAAIEKSEGVQEGIAIARALLNEKTTWKEMADILKKVTEEPETIRYLVLSYMTTVLSGGRQNRRAYNVLKEFQFNWYDSKKAGMYASCYSIIVGGD
jgi:DNA polymerase-3 subunit gamma/tau